MLRTSEGRYRSAFKILVMTEILFYFIYLILFFNFTILYWFCHISTWIRHRYTRVPHPEPSSLLPPVPSLWVIPVQQSQASSIVHRTWTGDSFHIWYYTCFNAISLLINYILLQSFYFSPIHGISVSFRTQIVCT